MRTNKFIILSMVFIALALLAVSFASAEFWSCADKGDKINYCNNYKPPRTCTSNNGCIYCMSEYRSAEDCYIHGVWPQCNQLPQTCDLTDGNGSNVDGEPPQLTVTSPDQDELFDSRKALVEFSVNELADVYYTNVVDGRGRWSRLCSNCDSYAKNLSFDEGQNIIQLKAVDDSGNEALSGNISFFTDSKKPKIKKTLPKKGFANGEFEVQFQEANPTNLIIFYGINGSSQANVDLGSCIPSGTSNDKMSCRIDVDLSSYDGQEITYWFSLTDIVGNNVNSKPISLGVDMTAPQVLNPGDFFHYENGTRYVYFHLNITEENFDEVIYSYLDDRGRLKEKMICSRLKEGMCEKKVSFREGEWHLTVSAWDEAGNSVALPADFVVDY